MATILIIEDDTKISELMVRCLTMAGHHCLTALRGSEGILIAEEMFPDLILLDINLPDMSGFEVIKEIDKIPTIYVTARGEIKDRIKGLNGGAEDYLVKPFNIQELLARVNVVLRRYEKEETTFKIDDVTIDFANYKVFRGDEELEITRQEYYLLKALVDNRNMTLSREQLLNMAWGYDYEGDIRTVDVHIQRVRKKLDLGDYIKTIFKMGYRLEI